MEVFGKIVLTGNSSVKATTPGQHIVERHAQEKLLAASGVTMDLSIRDIFRKIVGGDEERFFRDYWRKRTLFTESALPCLQSFYDLDQFVRDYHELGCHDSTLVISVDKEKKRRMLHVTQSESVDSALARGMSVVVQAL